VLISTAPVIAIHFRRIFVLIVTTCSPTTRPNPA